MPLYKFKTHDEARRALWCKNPDSAYYERVRALFDAAWKFGAFSCEKGVRCFKTLKEAQEALLKSRIERIKRLEK